jgi:uncharacterized protein (DUF58 family)
MCLITGLVALATGITFASVGSALGAGAGAALGVGLTATVVADVLITGAAVGGTLATVSAVQQAEAAQEQAEFQASIERENAKLAAIEAENIELQANQDRHQLRLKMLASKGEARAAYAAGGVVLGAGSSADYEADIADAYDLDKRNLNYDIAQKKWQAKVQSINASNQASLYTAQAHGFGQQKASAALSGVFNTVTDTVGAGVSALNFGAGLGKLSKEAGWA